MSLSPLITRTDLEMRAGDADRLAQYATANDANVERACRVATARFRESAIKQYSEASVDALTAATVDESVRDYIVSIAMDVLTKGGQGRPDTIADDAKEAKDWLDALEIGKKSIQALSRRGSVAYVLPDLVFNQDEDDEAPSFYRDQDI